MSTSLQAILLLVGVTLHAAPASDSKPKTDRVTVVVASVQGRIPFWKGSSPPVTFQLDGDGELRTIEGHVIKTKQELVGIFPRPRAREGKREGEPAVLAVNVLEEDRMSLSAFTGAINRLVEAAPPDQQAVIILRLNSLKRQPRK